MVMMFFGDMKKDAIGAVLRWYRFLLDVLGSSRGWYFEFCCVELSTVAAGGFQERLNQVWVDADDGNCMVNASRRASTWLHRFHPQTPSDDVL